MCESEQLESVWLDGNLTHELLRTSRVFSLCANLCCPGHRGFPGVHRAYGMYWALQDNTIIIIIIIIVIVVIIIIVIVIVIINLPLYYVFLS